ncbi:hypothetical protein [Lysobacter tyrosinilyticus]
MDEIAVVYCMPAALALAAASIAIFFKWPFHKALHWLALILVAIPALTFTLSFLYALAAA